MARGVVATFVPDGPPIWRPGLTGPSYETGGPFPETLGYVVEMPDRWRAVAIVPGTPERPAHATRHLGDFPTEAEARAAVEAAVRPRAPPG